MFYTIIKSVVDVRALASKNKVIMRDLSDLFFVLLASVFCFLLKHIFNFFFKQRIVDNITAQNIADTDHKIMKVLK
jgi:hypothetical protein